MGFDSQLTVTEPTARPTTTFPASGHGSSSRAETPTRAATAAANTVPTQRWIALFVVEPRVGCIVITTVIVAHAPSSFSA